MCFLGGAPLTLGSAQKLENLSTLGLQCAVTKKCTTFLLYNRAIVKSFSKHPLLLQVLKFLNFLNYGHSPNVLKSLLYLK